MRAAMTPNSRTDLVERKTVTVIEPLKQKKPLYSQFRSKYIHVRYHLLPQPSTPGVGLSLNIAIALVGCGA
jgi:hypothetical protein